jgi:hypothetical protein
MHHWKFVVSLVAFFLIGLAAYELFPERPGGAVIKNYGGIDGEVVVVPNLKVQFWKNGDLFAARGMSVFRSRDMGMTWKEVAKLGKGAGSLTKEILRQIGSLKVISKIRHKDGINRVMILDDDTILVAYGGIYGGTLEEGEVVRLEKRYSWSGGGPFFQ